MTMMEHASASWETKIMAALTVVVEKDEEGYFVASCPALKGCWSQGRTEEEALSNIHEAIEGWIEAEETRATSCLQPGQHLHEVVLP
jgi:predicted RNase H-like HicB family nuclease